MFNGKNKYFTVGGIVGLITLTLVVCIATIPGNPATAELNNNEVTVPLVTSALSLRASRSALSKAKTTGGLMKKGMCIEAYMCDVLKGEEKDSCIKLLCAVPKDRCYK